LKDGPIKNDNLEILGAWILLIGGNNGDLGLIHSLFEHRLYKEAIARMHEMARGPHTIIGKEVVARTCPSFG
jgi:hypothetical protein